MKKHLDVATISNELRESSVFFRQEPSPQKEPMFAAESPPPEQPHIPVPVRRSNDRPVERPPVHTTERTHDRLNERTKVRNAFDIFADQLYALREIALKRSKAQGTRITLGDVVQEALDTFIKATT